MAVVEPITSLTRNVIDWPLSFQMMYALETGGAYTAKAAPVVVVNRSMAYTAWLLAAVDVGPLVNVRAWLAAMTLTVWYPATDVSRMYARLLLVVSPHVPAWVPSLGSSIRRLDEYVLIGFPY